MVSTLIPSADLAPSVTSRVLIVKATDFTEGAPAKGTITFSLPWDVDVKPDGVILQAGSKTLDFDETGQMQIRVPTADPDTNPTAWFLTVKKSWAPHAYAIRVPVGTTPINLVDVPIVQEVPAGTPAGVLLTGASATVKIGAAPDVKTTVAAGVANFDFTLPDYGPELAKVEVERIAAQAAKTEAQTAATASSASAQQSAGSAAAAAASAAQAAAPTDTVVSTLLTTPTSLARRALDTAVADKRSLLPTTVTAATNFALLRTADSYHVPTDAIAAASTGLPVPLAGFLSTDATARARKNLVSDPRGTNTALWRASSGDTLAVVTDGGEPAIEITQSAAGTSAYLDPNQGFYVLPGDVVTFKIEVKAVAAMSAMRTQLSSYSGLTFVRSSPDNVRVLNPADGWQAFTVTGTVGGTAGGFLRALVWPTNTIEVGPAFRARKAIVEVAAPAGSGYYDGSMPPTNTELFSWEGAANASPSLASGFIAREYRTLTGRRFTQQLTAAGWSSWVELATAASAPPRTVNPALAGVPVGTGADATTALRALIASLPAGSTLACDPTDVYVLSGQVDLPKAVRIQRMTISVGGYTGGVLNIASSDVWLDALTISGATNVGTPVGAARFITASGTSSTRFSGVRVENCTLSGCRGSFIWLEWCVDPTVRRNYLSNGQYAGIMLISPKGGQVSDNVIRELLMTAPQVNAYGIAVTDWDNVLSARAEDVLISGNYVEGVRDWEGIDTHGGRNIQIVNNTVRSCRTPIAVTTGNTARAYAPEDCIVMGNFVEKGTANSETAGIVFNGKTGGTLPDRYATGFVGQNVIRGFAIDLIRDMTDGLRTTVTRQESDATTVASPDAAPYRQWIARTSVTSTAGSPGGTTAVTFPAGKFLVTPVVQVSKQSGVGAKHVAYATDISTTGCTVGIYDPSGGTGAVTVPLVITVTQATETSAVGSPRG